MSKILGMVLLVFAFILPRFTGGDATASFIVGFIGACAVIGGEN